MLAKRAIHWFIHANQQLSRWAVNGWPWLFRCPPYRDELLHRINEDITRLHPARVAELGGADRPMLARGAGYWFIGVDIDDKPQCHKLYDEFIAISVKDPLPIPVDIAVSMTLLEHVSDNHRAIGSIAASLSPGGRTHHYVPSKWHPYSVVLRIVGPALQKKLISLLRPEAASVTGYPAFFDHCSPGQMAKLFQTHGFTAIDIKPFYGGAGYFTFFFPAFVAVRAFERVCEVLRIRVACSGFIISATRPRQYEGETKPTFADSSAAQLA